MSELIPLTLSPRPSANNARSLFDPATHSGRVLPYDLIDDTLRESTEFNKQVNPEQGEYLLGEFADFSDAMQGVPGFKGVFGTGHPFYAIEKDGSVTDIPEITRFIETTREKVRADSWRYAGKWACAGCQEQSNLPDLKQFCKPCRVVDLKPRDVFKALPDLDFWVVVDTDNPEIEADIEKRSQDAGFYQSDVNVFKSVADTNKVLKAINYGEDTEARLPIDLHVVTQQELETAMNSLKDLKADDKSPFIPIQPRSLHVSWERADQPYNFAQDFLLSMTEAAFAPKLREAVYAARIGLVDNFTNDQLSQIICNSDAKSARQLADSKMMQILHNRFNAWRQI